MKTLFLSALAFVSIALASCKNTDDPVSYDYHSHIMQPSTADKNIGEVLSIAVEFESHTGEAVEHINIRIHNKANTVEVYNKPDDPHVDSGVSVYEFEDQIVLSAANGFTAGDWVLVATVWGKDEGQDEVVETVEFHVHP